MINKETISNNIVLPKGVKLIAFDFDNTIINFHTKGFFPKKDIHKLKEYTLPFFSKIVPILLDNNYYVGIATFSDDRYIPDERFLAGKTLIKEFLNLHFPDHAKRFLIEAFDPGYDERRRFTKMPKEFREIDINKNKHLIRMKYNISQKVGQVIGNHQIILFDDTKNNIKYIYKDMNGFVVPSGQLNEHFWNQCISNFNKNIISITYSLSKKTKQIPVIPKIEKSILHYQNIKRKSKLKKV